MSDANFINVYNEVILENLNAIMKQNFMFQTQMKFLEEKVSKIPEMEEKLASGSNKILTIDHVLPRSRGGRNTWTNLVTCCQKCNLRKADSTPEEAGMRMRKKAFEPSLFSEEFYPSMAQVWEDYKNSF